MIRRLYLTGNYRDKKASAYYSWPNGETQRAVEKIIEGWKRAFPAGTKIVIDHFHDDM